MLQGATLPWVVRRLGVRGPDPLEDRLQEAAVLQDATAAGLRVLDELAPPGSDPDPDGTIANLRLQSQRRTHLAWERLGQRTAQDESPSQRAVRLRLEMLRAEHAEVLRIRDTGTVAHEVLERVMALLDLEEAVLVGADDVVEEMDAHDGDLLAPERPGGQCEHLLAAPAAMVPATPGACPDCIVMGITWVHLRMCLECGNVGCCDSSQGKHAAQHFHQTGHPVMRSVESGEAWRWCFRDEELG
jgi:CPA1 family monovalent cation:H+ antiporter